jgi:hypothetical protein
MYKTQVGVLAFFYTFVISRKNGMAVRGIVNENAFMDYTYC